MRCTGPSSSSGKLVRSDSWRSTTAERAQTRAGISRRPRSRRPPAIVKAEPELGDPQNPVFQAVAQLVNQSPYARFFRAHPDGIRAAVEVAKLQTSAARLPALQKELDTARQEIARLNKLTQPVGGPPAGPAPGKKPLAEMTMDEADAYLRAQAEAADRGEIT